MRAITLAALVATLTHGCAYHFGSTSHARTVTGVGYDSGLAYGTGMQVARSFGIQGPPKGVNTGCPGYLVKPMIAVAGGFALTKASDGKFDRGVATIAVLGAIVLWLAPNCAATLYFDAPAESAPPVPPSGDRQLPPTVEPRSPANSAPLPAPGGGDPFKQVTPIGATPRPRPLR